MECVLSYFESHGCLSPCVQCKDSHFNHLVYVDTPIRHISTLSSKVKVIQNVKSDFLIRLSWIKSKIKGSEECLFLIINYIFSTLLFYFGYHLHLSLTRTSQLSFNNLHRYPVRYLLNTTPFPKLAECSGTYVQVVHTLLS